MVSPFRNVQLRRCNSCARSPLGESEIERRALSGLRTGPDSSAMPLDHLLANSEADSRARIFLAIRVESLEDHEDPVGILLAEADAVVFHAEAPFVGLFLRAHPNLRSALVIA